MGRGGAIGKSSLQEASEILEIQATHGVWLSTRIPMEHGLLGCLTGSILDLFLFAAALPIAAIVVAIRRCGPRDRPWNEYRGSVFCVLTADEIVFLSALSSLLPRKPLLAVLFRRRRSELVECQGVGTSGARVVFRFDNGFYAELYLADGGDSFAAFRAEALSHQAQRDA